MGKFEIPSKNPIWMDWKAKEVKDIEFGGVKFQAAQTGYAVMVGEKLHWGQFGFQGGTHPPASYNKNIADMSSDSNSCAYQRIYPTGHDRKSLLMWAWWLENFYIPRGTVCYLTKHDGNVNEIKRVLNRRGFRTACVTNSKHAGHYPVYLLIHPGDEALREKKNKKNKVVENVDVLGNSDANVPQPGNVGDTVECDRPPAPVQDAFALGA